MKSLLHGIFTAFSMYSTIPMPQITWNKSSMNHTFCFFPLIGLLIGIMVYAWVFLGNLLSLSPFFFACGMVAIPLFISGGIHLDGLIDTSDALSSNQALERKLEILKDPHVGAFGVMSCSLYFIFQFGISAQFFENTIFLPIVCIGFILSRTLGALSVINFKIAKSSGLAYVFGTNSNKKKVRIVLYCYLILLFSMALMTHFMMGCSLIFVCTTLFFCYKKMAYKQFGGITGDLAGYFIVLLELFILL
ncbi:MAG: adenosylcobinamide-GDP ribazoletransferase, partial [Oscillospiraceae bacterium]